MRVLMPLMLAGLLAAPVGAQRPMGMQSRPMAMHDMMGMMTMHAGPGMVLALAEPLELSDAQLERIQAIHEETQQTVWQHMRQAMQVMQDAADLVRGEARDLDAYEARLRDAADHGVLGHMARARAMAQVYDILSAEQRETLETGVGMMVYLMQNRPAMMPGMMMPGMMESMMPGMMRGMMGTTAPDTSGMR